MQTIELYNDQLRVDLMDFGARVISIRLCEQSMPNALAQTQPINLVQGYQNINDYLTDAAGMGATMGPITNRISYASLMLNGHRYSLPSNEGANCLHSGGVGFDRCFWSLVKQTDDCAVFELTYDLADIGMLGRLNCQACYRLVDSELQLNYSVKTDALSYLNLTNHVYLNLSGTRCRIDDHRFSLFADQVAMVDDQRLPTGKVVSINKPTEYQLNQQGFGVEEHSGTLGTLGNSGVDHHFIVQPELENNWKKMARVISISTGIAVDIYSDAPGFQFYTGDHLSHEFEAQSAFSIEPQSIPDAINRPEFEVKLIPANSVYRRSIAWNFSQATVM
jgi:aldose 1-epimerase